MFFPQFQESSLASMQPEIAATFTKTTAAKRIPTNAFQVTPPTTVAFIAARKFCTLLIKSIFLSFKSAGANPTYDRGCKN
jgi:hypothetical protein